MVAGRDRFSDATMTPTGPVYVGYGQSDVVALGGLSINNLQHQRAMNETGSVGAPWGPNRGGETALFSMLISNTDEVPPCVASCPTGEMNAVSTTIAPGQCYAHTECLADGQFSSFVPCFQCSPSSNQMALSGPVTTNYCYFNNECVPTGTMAPAYQRRSDPSVCEWCDPSVDPVSWSLRSGYVHDRNFASAIETGPTGYGGPGPTGRAGQSNLYGMLFEQESNGCQIMPDMNMPTSPSAFLLASMVHPVSATIASTSTLVSGAIAAIRSATSANQHVEIGWVRYLGNTATCTRVGDVCQHTPAAMADAMGAAFATNLHYGHSVARVKVQQGLAVLRSAISDSSPAGIARKTNLTKDIVAHMLVPYYQGVIQSAHLMDVSAGAAQAAARADGAAYWQVINDAVGQNFNAADRAFLTNMFASPASGTFNHCAASTRLMANLPAASSLQYHNFARAGTLNTVAMSSIVHVTATDVGDLQASLVGGQPVTCTMPPPAPPSPPPSQPSPPPQSSTAASPSASPVVTASPPSASSPSASLSASPSASPPALLPSTSSAQEAAGGASGAAWGNRSPESLAALVLAIFAFLMSLVALVCQARSVRKNGTAMPMPGPTAVLKEVDVVMAKD